MNADVLEMISYVAFTGSFLFFVLAAVLFWKLDIRAIIDDLSGKKAERQIQAYREQSAGQQSSQDVKQGRIDYANFESTSAGETTAELEKTTLLYYGTVLLEESVESDSCCKLILNEMVVHTGERI